MTITFADSDTYLTHAREAHKIGTQEEFPVDFFIKKLTKGGLTLPALALMASVGITIDALMEHITVLSYFVDPINIDWKKLLDNCVVVTTPYQGHKYSLIARMDFLGETEKIHMNLDFKYEVTKIREPVKTEEEKKEESKKDADVVKEVDAEATTKLSEPPASKTTESKPIQPSQSKEDKVATDTKQKTNSKASKLANRNPNSGADHSRENTNTRQGRGDFRGGRKENTSFRKKKPITAWDPYREEYVVVY
jgi:hypothetical protein